MNIHEYQAKDIFREYGIPTPNGIVADNVESARAAWNQLGTRRVVVKAQIHAGGRGKGRIISDNGSVLQEGGVKLAESEAETISYAKIMLGNRLVTRQTGSDGSRVKKVLIESGASIAREFYVGIVIDRASAAPVLMVSTAGGMDIETVAAQTPDAIKTFHIDPDIGLRDFNARQAAFALGLSGSAVRQGAELFKSLAKLFLEKDASLAEINPLVLTKDNALLAIDAKLNIDDNALFRQTAVGAMKESSETTELESAAAEHGLSYIKLDGTIGCMVNGAGLAMATMDAVSAAGGMPANFLDVGGSATSDRVAAALRIILSDPNVKAILVNIFGGIMKCDTLADGLVEGAKQVKLNVPLIIRLEGTNVEKGREILAASGLNIIRAGDIGEAARQAVGRAAG